MESKTITKVVDGRAIEVRLYTTDIGNLYAQNFEFLGKIGVLNSEGGIIQQNWCRFRRAYETYKGDLNYVVYQMRTEYKNSGGNSDSWLENKIQSIPTRTREKRKNKVVYNAFEGM